MIKHDNIFKLKRTLAFFTDIILFWWWAFFVNWDNDSTIIILLLFIILWLFKDSIMSGQGLGNGIWGLRVIKINARPIGIKESISRSSAILILPLLSTIAAIFLSFIIHIIYAFLSESQKVDKDIMRILMMMFIFGGGFILEILLLLIQGRSIIDEATNTLIVTKDYYRKLWQDIDITLQQTYTGFSAEINTININETQNKMVILDRQGTLFIRSLNKGELLHNLNFDEFYIKSITLNGLGNILACSCSDEVIRVIDMTSMKVINEINCGEFNDTLSINNAGNILACSFGRNIKLFYAINGGLIKSLQEFPDDVSLSTYNNNILAVASGGTLYLFDILSKYENIAKFKKHWGEITSVIFSPKNDLLAYIIGSDKIVLINLVKKVIIREIEVSKTYINSIVFSLDGIYILGACEDSSIKIWRVFDGELMKEIGAHSGSINCIVTFEDNLILSGGDDCLLKLWRISFSELLVNNNKNENTINKLLNKLF